MNFKEINKSSLNLVIINQANLLVFKNLAQAYEAEFSNLTHKQPDELGLFEIDMVPYDPPYTGYLFYYLEVPVGFCVANINGQINDIAEFYVVPSARKKNVGCQLAFMVFDKHPGEWQVRQIEGANVAIQFWRAVINKYTQHQYEEAIVKDPKWGLVTRQKFFNHNK